MESENRFRKETPANSSSQEKSSKRNRSFNYEVTWPLFVSTLTLRPLHMWNVGRRAGIQEGERVLELGANYPLWKIYSGKVGRTGLFYTHITPKDVFREAFRVLKPKGRIISSAIGCSDADLLRETAFTNVQVKMGIPSGILLIPNIFTIASKPPSRDNLRGDT